ncbi:helix-turn-helix domain-containing protein [Cohnella nanjingensis]
MIGENISRLRIRKSLTAQQLAERTGLTREQVLRFEHGEARPSDIQLSILANTLDVTVPRILGTDIDFTRCNIHVNGGLPSDETSLEDLREWIREMDRKNALRR